MQVTSSSPFHRSISGVEKSVPKESLDDRINDLIARCPYLLERNTNASKILESTSPCLSEIIAVSSGLSHPTQYLPEQTAPFETIEMLNYAEKFAFRAFKEERHLDAFEIFEAIIDSDFPESYKAEARRHRAIILMGELDYEDGGLNDERLRTERYSQAFQDLIIASQGKDEFAVDAENKQNSWDMDLEMVKENVDSRFLLAKCLFYEVASLEKEPEFLTHDGCMRGMFASIKTPEARFYSLICLLYGFRGVSAKEIDAFNVAEGLGIPEGHLLRGYCYENGIEVNENGVGVAKDLTLAIKSYEQALVSTSNIFKCLAYFNLKKLSEAQPELFKDKDVQTYSDQYGELSNQFDVFECKQMIYHFKHGILTQQDNVEASPYECRIMCIGSDSDSWGDSSSSDEEAMELD